MSVIDGMFRVCFFAVIVENGVRLRLNIVDTPGYGDQVNNDNWWVFSCFALYSLVSHA